MAHEPHFNTNTELLAALKIVEPAMMLAADQCGVPCAFEATCIAMGRWTAQQPDPAGALQTIVAMIRASFLSQRAGGGRYPVKGD